MRAVLLLILLLAAAPAFAGSAPVQATSAPADTGAQEPAIANPVEMPALVAPVVGGRSLLGYLYLDVVVDAAAPGKTFQVRERAHLLQDAFVRAVHQVPVAASFDESAFDRAALQGRLLAEAGRILGPGVAAGVVIRDAKPSPR